MTLIQQTYTQAVLISGLDDPKQGQLLQLFCRGAVNDLAKKLRPGMTPDDCRADLVAAGALYALAALSEWEGGDQPEQLKLGDLTVKPKKGNTAAQCLRTQAGLIIAPYVQDKFAFRRV